MKIFFLLESCELSGGVRVIFDLARALTARGHTVTVLTRRGSAEWYPYPLTVVRAADFALYCHSTPPDIVIASFWTTVADAVRCQAPLTLHFCQGCEWECPEYGMIFDQIITAYQIPIPKITIGPWLETKIRKQTASSVSIFSIGQCVDLDLYRPRNIIPRIGKRLFRRATLRLLIPGIFQASVKGIRHALEAVAILRQSGKPVEVVRVSALPPSEEELLITPIDAYHIAISSKKMLTLYHQADLTIVPSLEGEGFGLPFVEAIATGCPAIATEISSFQQIARSIGVSNLLVTPGNSVAIASKIETFLTQPEPIRRQIASSRPKILRHYSSTGVAAAFEQAVMQLKSHE